MGLGARLKAILVSKDEKRVEKRPERPSEKGENSASAPSFVSFFHKDEKTHHDDKLESIDKKLDDLLEIKKLYEDMLDWMVELAKKQKNIASEPVATSRDPSTRHVDESTDGSDRSILSPRLRQVLDVLSERGGEGLAKDVSVKTGLSVNRCSEMLSALHRANYVEKSHVGREVYYKMRNQPIVDIPRL